ncbi:hypothetical protein BC941DRAFT_408165 [Chlamydoabsidia padenii]|nr:hypothetical protein BC941DRAFT_408165 [Chlamydoabsidia padenii]
MAEQQQNNNSKAKNGENNDKSGTEQTQPSLSRSHSHPGENGKQGVNKIPRRRMEGLNPQENWKKLKRLAYRTRQSSFSNVDNIKRKNTSVDDENYTAGIPLVRRLEYNQIPVTLLAMMAQQDEKGLPRIPVLLSILSVQVNRISDTSLTNDKKMSRRNLSLVVSYGTLQWTLYRQFWDFVKLHYSYCGYDLARARRPIGIPVFPSMVLHRRHRLVHRRRNQPTSQQNHRSQSTQPRSGSRSNSTLASDDRFSLGCIDDSEIQHNLEYDNHDEQNQSSSSASASSPTEDPHGSNNHLQQQQIQNQNRHDRVTTINSTPTPNDEKYDKLLEKYMMQLINATLHTGNINRLCKFLEISTLGIHLRATQPQGYHGKEGFMVIVARTDHGPKHSRWKFGGTCFGSNSNHIPAYKNSPKWFIIRENYMVCVNHPHDINSYDVILFEPGLQVERGCAHHSKSKTNKLKVTIKTAAKLSLGHSTLCIRSSAGEMYLRAKNVGQAIQFEQSLLRACRQSTWCLPSQRFNSFAPVRPGCPTTWFVDGDDYFFQVSVALANATKYIYIHDWWLSPELYLRRPPSQNEEWRLDMVLKRKAEQGVKVYIIVYKEVAMAVPLFSHYTKKHLLSLSSNIYVQRHPSRALDILSNQGTLFYAHHEKICLIDGLVAFIGGLDLCFGRFDTARHRVTDDPPTIGEQTWVGKDYSNPRIEDFHALDKPFEDNINRSSLPRMPWHDISVRICGAAAHDVEHHFVQRWNYLRRQKSTAPKRPTPMLLPTAGFPDGDGVLDSSDPRIGSEHSSLHTQVQILRSVSAWSTGVEETEHSIMDAYVDLIGKSRHFIYIENQFFITSTQYGATVIDNKIGDALYQRILRAHQEKENWYAIIVMPLVPEFPGTFDLADGTTIRLIMYLQYLSIGRGPDSILGKLRAAGITNTSQYIKFYSLRNWGELNGSYVTEQVYIHAKTMIVDDRTVMIGSANINERSMLGCRDSEICACIEDMDLLDSTFGGQSVKVGRFAHSLRLRLMAEHIGLPAEGWDIDTLLDHAIINKERTNKRKDKDMQQTTYGLDSSTKLPDSMANAPSCHLPPAYHSNSPPLVQQQSSRQTIDQQLKHTNTNTESNEGNNHSTAPAANEERCAIDRLDSDDAITITNLKRTSTSSTTTNNSTNVYNDYVLNEETLSLYKDWATWDTDTDNNGDEHSLVPLPLLLKVQSPDAEADDQTNNSAKSPALTICSKGIDRNFIMVDGSGDSNDGATAIPTHDHAALLASLRDPLEETSQFLWDTCARHNTDLFRRCFMVLPDNNVRSWAAYDNFDKMARQILGRADPTEGVSKHMSKAKTTTLTSPPNDTCFMLPFVPSLLKQIKGHLVVWPARFMEEEGDDFVFAMDKIVPLEIFD